MCANSLCIEIIRLPLFTGRNLYLLTPCSAAEKFEDVQKDVASLLEGRILVGHAVHNDLKVCRQSSDTLTLAILNTHMGVPYDICAYVSSGD